MSNGIADSNEGRKIEGEPAGGGNGMIAFAHALVEAVRLVGAEVGLDALLSGMPDGRETVAPLAPDVVIVEYRLSVAHFGIAMVPWVAASGANAAVGGGDITRLVLVALASDSRTAWMAEADGTGKWRLGRYGCNGRIDCVEAETLPEAGPWQCVAPAVEDRAAPAFPEWIKDALRTERPQYLRVVGAALLINLFALGMPLYSMAVFDRIAPNAAYTTLWTLTAGMFIVLTFDWLLRIVRSHIADIAARRIDVTVSRQIFEHLLVLALGRSGIAAGTMADRLRGFVMVQEFLTSARMLLLVDLPFLLLFTGILFVIGGPIGWIVVLMIPLMLCIGWVLHIPMERVTQRAMIEGQERHGTLVETIGALEVIRGTGAERFLRRRWREQIAASSISHAQARFLGNIATSTAVFLQYAGVLAVTVAGVFRIEAGLLSLGGLIACTMLASRALTPMCQATAHLTRAWGARLAARDIARFAQTPRHREAVTRYLSRPELQGDVSVNGACFAYPSHNMLISNPEALKDIFISVAPGERVVILGRIGSGKSTLLKLMAGIYAPHSGSVCVGGIDINQIDPAELRAQVGYVVQEPLLFTGSIADNISIGWPEATAASIVRAAAVSGAEEFVKRLPEGYRYRLGERGTGLSAGQRQTIAIAQALVRDPSVLLLDEPTSAMDQASETRFVARLKAYLDTPGKKRTLILVTHKPAMLPLGERIIVLDGGRVVADGKHEEVMALLARGVRLVK